MPKPPLTERQISGAGQTSVNPIQRWLVDDRKYLLHREDGPASVIRWRGAMRMEWYAHNKRRCWAGVVSENIPMKVGC